MLLLLIIHDIRIYLEMTTLYFPGIPTYLQELDRGPGKTMVQIIMMFDRVSAWTKRIFEKRKTFGSLSNTMMRIFITVR